MNITIHIPVYLAHPLWFARYWLRAWVRCFVCKRVFNHVTHVGGIIGVTYTDHRCNRCRNRTTTPPPPYVRKNIIKCPTKSPATSSRKIH